jgi:sulfur carrier protein ThiS
MPKVKLNLPSGLSKTVQYPKDTSITDVMSQVEELAGKGEFAVKLGDEALEPDVLEELEVVDGDELTFSPVVVGGLKLAA